MATQPSVGHFNMSSGILLSCVTLGPSCKALCGVCCCVALLTAVCANINLFMEINEEEFEKYLQTFVTDVWHLLMQVCGAVAVGHLIGAVAGPAGCLHTSVMPSVSAQLFLF